MIKNSVIKRQRSWWSSGNPKSLLGRLLVGVCMLCGLAVDGAITDGFQSKTAYACEDDQLILQCQLGEVIRILRANYGRFTISVCNRHGQTEGWNLQCMSPKAKDIISERCDGRQECAMRVSNLVFSDPCPSTSKYAEVKYTCHLDGSPRPPQITSATAFSPTQIRILWTQAEPPSPVVTTAVYLKDLAMETEPSPIFMTNFESSLTLDDLRPNTTYSIFLKSFNNHGPSMASNVVTVTTPLLEFADKEYFIPTTVKMVTMREDFFGISTKHPSYTTTSSNTVKTTSATTMQTVVAHEELIPPDIDPSEDYSPHESLVSVDVDQRYENVNGVVDKFCEEKIDRGVLWSRTASGRTLERNCPEDMKGIATWQCLDSGWDKSGPDLTDCTSAWIENLDVQINRVMRGEEDADEVAMSLNEASIHQEYTSGDLKKVSTKLLPKLAKGLQRDDSVIPIVDKIYKMKKFKKAFMSTSSGLLSKKNVPSWKNLSRQDRRRAATSLVLAVEDVGFHTARLMEPGTSDVTVDENIVLKVLVVDTRQTHSDISFPSRNDLYKSSWETEAGSDSITIKSTSLKIVGMKGCMNIVFTLYKNMEDMMQPQINTIPSVQTLTVTGEDEEYYNTETVGDGDSGEGSGTNSLRVVNSKIIAATINNTRPGRKLAEPVSFTLQHLEPNTNGKPLCSFWDMNTSYLSGQWSQKGCRPVDTNATHTTCECDHLTNFAILMDITGVKLSQENKLALRVITFVGCAISVICLLFSWFTFLVFKNLQCDRNTIHTNLVFCLLLAEVVFLSGIAQTEPKILCAIIAGLLHYLFLGAFAWMCLEGIQLYIMLVEVFEAEKSRVHWFYLFGYGAPAVVVAVSAGVYHEGYGTDRHCWLTTDNYFIWSFVGPALAVILVNIGMLSVAIYTMCRHSVMSVTVRDRPKTARFRTWLKGAVVLVVLLGLTWLLGVLYLNEESVVIAYFFTVLNSLQGLFIFIFHCLKNEKVQKEYRKVVRRTTWLPDCIRVNYGGYTGMATSSQVVTSDSRSYLSKLFGQKRHSLSTSNSAKPFLNNSTGDQQSKNSADSSVNKDTSNIPSSLNGYVYNPNYAINGNGNIGSYIIGSNHPEIEQVQESGVAENGYEVVGEMAADLSDCADCSVVDSEYLTEYCKHSLQVSRDECRYSTSSEDSYEENPINSQNTDHQKSQSIKSSERHKQKQPVEHQLNFHQYVIPASRGNSLSKANTANVGRTPPIGGNEFESKCLTRNPLPCHSSVRTEMLPQNCSSHNENYKEELSEAKLKSSATNCSESNYLSAAVSEPAYEEVKIIHYNPTSKKSSLPKLHMNEKGLPSDVKPIPTVSRHHSDRILTSSKLNAEKCSTYPVNPPA